MIAPLSSAARALLGELQRADRIIAVMLHTMTAGQQSKAAAKLETEGISPDGMTRSHERRAVIDAAAVAMAAPSGATAPDAVMLVARAIDDVTMDIDGAACTAGVLLDLAAQECTGTELHRAFCAVMAAGRYLGDIAALTEKVRGLEHTARKGGAS